MTSKRNLSEAETLEIYRLTLANARNSPEIAKDLAAIGYDSKKLAIGDELFAKVRKASQKSRLEKVYLRNAYRTFSSLKKSVSESYSIHRKMAKVAFRNDHETAEKLTLNTTIPKAYSKWQGMIKKFYTDVSKQEILTKLSEYKLEGAALAEELNKIRKLEKARTKYIKKKAESLKATAMKDAAFDEIYEWMKDFDALSKIAMREHPKMRIAFGKKVKG